MQETQSGIGLEGERAKERAEIEKTAEETKKRKRGAKEAETEQKNDRVRNFISDEAFVLMEKGFKDRGVVFERGFNKLVSHFIEMLEKREWKILGEHKAPGFVALVKDFFANMVGVEGHNVYFIGEWVSFSRETIKEMFNLKVRNGGSKFKKLLKEPEYQKIVDLLTGGKGKWKAIRKSPYESIARCSLTEEAKVWFYFVCSTLLPSKHLNTVRKNETILLYAMPKGYRINVGKIIENSIMSYYKSKYRGLIPHPATITRLCLVGGVGGDWENEETCPKVSPLTLVGVTKGLKNRDKEKEMEA